MNKSHITVIRPLTKITRNQYLKLKNLLDKGNGVSNKQLKEILKDLLFPGDRESKK